MHYAAYVLLPKAEATTSLEARQEVERSLLNDESFVGEGGRFYSPVCDWFKIGGRFSGWLYPEQLRDEFFRQADQLNTEGKEPGWYSQEFVQSNRSQLDTIWQKLGGQYESPLTRDQHDGWGKEDDAQILTKALAERLNVFLQDRDKYSNAEDYCIRRKAPWSPSIEIGPAMISLDDDVLYGLTDFNTLVGNYWVVVIDYHT